MEIFLAVLLFIVGAIIVAKCADFFVDASSWVSDVTGISKVLIGATVVAIATSGPELFVSIFASVAGQSDMSTGNVVGSHLCNLGIGFALIAMFRPSKNSDKLYLPNSIITLITATLLLLFYFMGELTFVHGIILMLIYAVFTFINIRFNGQDDTALPLAQAQNEQAKLSAHIAGTQQQDSDLVTSEQAKEENYGDVLSISGQAQEENSNDELSVSLQAQYENASDMSVSEQASDGQVSCLEQKPKRVKKPTNKREIIINIIKFAIGITGIVLGSKLIVDKATILAKAMGVSEMIIGLTIVAVGTSLPEIVTTIAALIKKESDLGIGNIFGSCVFNNAFIIPISAFILGSLSFNDSVIIDLPVAILLTLLAIIPTAIGKKIYRAQGIAIAAIYFAYIVYLVLAN